MDYLSQLKDIKTAISSILSDIFSKGSKMKYTQLGEEVDSEISLNALVADMFEGEKLKCELADISGVSFSSSESVSYGSDLSVGDKGGDSASKICEASNKSCNASSVDSGNCSESEEMPCKLVITYHFSFDTEEETEENQDNLPHLDFENSEDNNMNCEHDYTFEESSFCEDDEEEFLEYSSIKNGSKNNLLDTSFEVVKDGIENVGHLDYDSDLASRNSIPELVPKSNTQNLKCVSPNKDSATDANEENSNMSKYCGNPATPTMRKGFIYYSSEVQLFQGELCYEDTCTEKKFKFARKLIKKVFPSQKYVVNS